MTRYEFTFSDERFLSGISVCLKYRSRSHFGKTIKIIATFFLALLAILSFIGTAIIGLKGVFIGLFLTAMIFLLFKARKIDYWLYKRGFQKSPFRNEHFQICISLDGCNMVSSKSEGKLKWSAFLKAIRFDEDFMLFLDLSDFVWLSKKELVEGTVEEVDSLIKANIKNYEIKNK